MQVCNHYWPFFSRFSETLQKDLADDLATTSGRPCTLTNAPGSKSWNPENVPFSFFGKHRSLGAEAWPLPFLVFKKNRNQSLFPPQELCTWWGPSLSCPVSEVAMVLLLSGPNNWDGQRLKAQYSGKNYGCDMAGPLQEKNLIEHDEAFRTILPTCLMWC